MKIRSLAAVAAILALAVAASADPKPNRAAPAQARIDVAAKLYPHFLDENDKSEASIERICEWSERWYTAQRELPLKGAALAAAADAHVARLDALAKQVDQLVKNQLADPFTKQIVAYYQAEAAVWAAEAHGATP